MPSFESFMMYCGIKIALFNTETKRIYYYMLSSPSLHVTCLLGKCGCGMACDFLE